MRAPGASQRVFWRFFDKIWSRNDPEKLETVPKREKCKLSSEQRVWGNSIGVWRLYLAPKMSNFQKTTNFSAKKTLYEPTPPSSPKKMIQGLGIFLWRLQYMINLCAKKNFAIQLSRKSYRLLKRGPGGILTLGDAFFKVFTHKEVFWGVK